VGEPGGTSTDVGLLVDGFPRESARAVEIGGVRTNYRMPDLISIGLGGGTVVRTGPDFGVGPDSVGYLLPERALIFGGDTTRRRSPTSPC
jgi:N-methylhydantoinase A/oxoprolinase/acetone carboxylase beta subunit